MMEFKNCTLENLKKAQDEVGDLLAQAVKTNVNFIDEQSHGILRSRITLFCALSGQGKTTILIALSKKLTRSHKCLYVTVEQEPNEMIMRINKVNERLFVTRLKSTDDLKIQWDEIKKYCIENKIEFLFYDYIGATGIGDNAVSEMVNEMNTLSDFAIDNKIGIVTACQASLEMIDYYNGRSNDGKIYMFTPKFIAFSKHIADKAAVAFYILKDAKDKNRIRTFCFKNRCFEHIQAERQWTLNYEKAELADNDEVNEILRCM